MTKPTSTDNGNKKPEKQDELAAKRAQKESEAAVSELYKKTPVDGPSQKIDDAILQAARDEVHFQPKVASTPYKEQKKWYVPIALAASILIVVGVIRVYSPGEDGQPDQIADTTSSGQEQTGPGPIMSGAGKSSPDKMLEHISDLIDKSQTEEAQKQFEAFWVLFPDFQIDYEKYPKLKSLKPAK